MADTTLLAKLPAILDAHTKWRRGQNGGSRANLYGANLSRADLYGADLSRANLYGADLYGADLYGADLSGADLSRANLYGADLSRANLSRANLYGADLSRANLYGADLSRANLYGADLSGANLSRANLSRANLSRANLSRANLSRANLSRANLSGADLSGADGLAEAKGLDPLPFGPVTLPDGPFRAYKLGRGPLGQRVIVALEIPEDAERVAPLVGRKCRASKAKVLALSEGDAAESWHQQAGRPVVIYRVGETVEADTYDPSPFVECSGGIHFLISRREAEAYS
jgi:hypothetical protein